MIKRLFSRFVALFESEDQAFKRKWVGKKVTGYARRNGSTFTVTGILTSHPHWRALRIKPEHMVGSSMCELDISERDILEIHE